MNSPTNPHSHDRTAEFLLLVTVLIWAFNAPLVKYGLTGMNIFVFNAIRFLLAAGILGALVYHRSSWQPVAREDWWPLLRLGLVANVLYQLAYIIGIHNTTAGNSAVLMSTAPLWTSVLSSIIHKEPPSRFMIAGTVISLSGIVLIIVGSGSKLSLDGNALLGDVLSLTAAFLWGANTTLQRNLLRRYSLMQVSFISIGIGSIGLTFLSLPFASAVPWKEIGPVFYLIPVVSGIGSIALANILWSNGVKRLGTHRTANYNNLVPVIAFIASYFMLHEEVVAVQVVGVCITLAGVWLARR